MVYAANVYMGNVQKPILIEAAVHRPTTPSFGSELSVSSSSKSSQASLYTNERLSRYSAEDLDQLIYSAK